jgi:hypothetical protein
MSSKCGMYVNLLQNRGVCKSILRLQAYPVLARKIFVTDEGCILFDEIQIGQCAVFFGILFFDLYDGGQGA